MQASKDAAEEGEVAYPSPSKPPLGAPGGRQGGRGGGQLRAQDLPSAPPLPSEEALAVERERQREPAMRA